MVSVINRLGRAVGSLFGRSGPQVFGGLQSPEPLQYSAAPAAPVSFDTAMQISAVWAAVRLWAETIASLPLIFYTDDTKSTPVQAGPLAELFGGKVNRYQTKIEFFETYILNLVLHGNAYALKQFVGGRLVGLLPLNSAQVDTKILDDDSVVHCYYHRGGVTVYADASIWHSKLFGNGIIGLSPLGYARNSIGIAIAAENRAGTTYRNGGKPAGVLTVDKVLKDNQRQQIRQEFKDLQEGNGSPLMVLEADLKYQTISMSPEDIQLLESRRFQIEDIARFFHVPSVLINDTSGSTVWGSGIAQIIMGWHKLNLRPALGRLETSMELNLRGAGDKTRAEFNMDDLLRPDMETRFKANATAINSGQMTPNEARADEGRAPKPFGDQLIVNGNMAPLKNITNPAKVTKPAPASEPVDDAEEIDEEDEDDGV